jgi:hypothetical protein
MNHCTSPIELEGPYTVRCTSARRAWLRNLAYIAYDLAFACAVVGFAVGAAYGLCKAYGL